MWTDNLEVVTDRVRIVREEVIFSLCTPFVGGTPSGCRGGGTPFPGLDGGYPLPRSGQGGVPPSQAGRGYPLPRSRWGGTPSQVWMVVPPSQVQGGRGPSRGTPLLEQHSMYLLHRGRYASCVRAGGLSC